MDTISRCIDLRNVWIRYRLWTLWGFILWDLFLNKKQTKKGSKKWWVTTCGCYFVNLLFFFASVHSFSSFNKPIRHAPIQSYTHTHTHKSWRRTTRRRHKMTTRNGQEGMMDDEMCVCRLNCATTSANDIVTSLYNKWNAVVFNAMRSVVWKHMTMWCDCFACHLMSTRNWPRHEVCCVSN